MTPRQLEVLDWVREFIADSGVAPTVRMVAERFDCGVSSAHRMLGELIAAGKLGRRSGKDRALFVPDLPDMRVVPTDSLVAELKRRGVAVIGERRMAYGRGARTCSADTCGEAVKVGMLFCRRHWFMLPRDLQDGLKRTHNAGEALRFQALLTTARDIVDGLTPETRARRVG